MYIFRYTLMLSSFCLLALLLSCGSDDAPAAPDPEAQLAEQLAGSWSVASASFDNSDRTSDYDGSNGSPFTLQLSYDAEQEQGSYTISGGPVGFRPFPETGTWTFASTISTPTQQSFDLNRAEDGVRLSVSDFSQSGFGISFRVTDPQRSGSRQQALVGQWFFRFVP